MAIINRSVKVAAKDWRISVAEDEEPPTWQLVKDTTTFTVSTSTDTTDDSVFSDGGDNAQGKVGIGKSLKIEGYYSEDNAGVRDPGQDLCDTYGAKMGSGSFLRVKVVDPSGISRYYWLTQVTPGDVGGGKKDKTSWGVTLDRYGPDLIPLVDRAFVTAGNATFATAGNQGTTIKGRGFTGATAVAFGSGASWTAATAVSVVDAQTITCTSPAKSAGSYDVKVTVPSGDGIGKGLVTYA